MMEAPQSASKEWVSSAYTNYLSATLGLRNHWYPVAVARKLGKKPMALEICGEKIVLVRSARRVYALANRCAHRGIPLSLGISHAPETITCPYHGWTYDLTDGNLVTILTDRPDSPLCGKASVSVKAYKVEVRAGLIWVYFGDGKAPALTADVPDEILDPSTTIKAIANIRPGNWRLAAEAGIDEGHARYLHRNSTWSRFRAFPAWTKFELKTTDDGWLVRELQDVTWSDTYERVGRWPYKRKPLLRGSRRGARQVGIRLPGLLRVVWHTWTSYEFYVPVDENSRLEIMLVAAKTPTPFSRVLFSIRYWTYINWLYNHRFHGQDNWVIQHMSIPPERLYEPDKSVTSWRKLVESDVASTGDRSVSPAGPTGTGK